MTRPWNHDHHTREYETHTNTLTGHTRHELINAWNQQGQRVYMAQSNASREAASRFTGPARARQTITRPAWAVSRGAA